MDRARRAAFDVLRMVRVDDAYTNLALPHVLAERGLVGRDAAFVTELASGTLRRRGTYDAILAACIDRPLAKVEAKVLDALRLGAHQLLSMRVPGHAAISTTVDLVRDVAGQGPAGFANAVLRRVSEHDLDVWVGRVAPDATTDPVGFAVVAHSHPRWVVEQLAEALGRPDELDALLAADNEAPRVTLVARPGRSTPDELPGERGRWSPYAVTLDGGQPGEVPAVAQGRAGVQDEGSQLVAIAAADVPLDGRDERWLDLCAGPGGKAALLAALASERGARVVANDAQPHRADLVRRALTDADGVEEVSGPRRPHSAVGAGILRPGPGRCAVLRTRRASPPPGGALAQAGLRPRDARAAPARAPRQRGQPHPPRRCRASTPPAHRCWRRRGGGRLRWWRRRTTPRLGAARRGGAGQRRSAARHRPGVAAPARHRRDGRRGPATQGLARRLSVMASPFTEIEVEDRVVKVTNPDRVYFPQTGATKLDLVECCSGVSEADL